MKTRKDIYCAELEKYKEGLRKKDKALVVYHLGRAHILSQDNAFRHVYIHWLMLLFSFQMLGFSEVLAQALRIVVTIPGHLIGRVPKGNIGWGSVGLMQTMPIPEDLKEIVN